MEILLGFPRIHTPLAVIPAAAQRRAGTQKRLRIKALGPG